MKTFLWALLIVSRAACPSVCFDRQGIRSRLYNGRAPPIPRRPPSRASTCLTSPAQRRRGGAPDGVFEALGRGLAPGLGPERQAVEPGIGDGERLYPDFAGALPQRLAGRAQNGAAERQDAVAVARRALGEQQHDVAGLEPPGDLGIDAGRVGAAASGYRKGGPPSW